MRTFVHRKNKKFPDEGAAGDRPTTAAVPAEKKEEKQYSIGDGVAEDILTAAAETI